MLVTSESQIVSSIPLKAGDSDIKKDQEDTSLEQRVTEAMPEVSEFKVDDEPKPPVNTQSFFKTLITFVAIILDQTSK